MNRLEFSFEPEGRKGQYLHYERKQYPAESVTEVWITQKVENGGTAVTFSEYSFEDNDPDGVRAAYGCLYPSKYSLTLAVTGEEAGGLVLYALDGGKITRGFAIDPQKAKAIFLLDKPLSVSEDALTSLTEALIGVPKGAYAYRMSIAHKLITDTLFGGRPDFYYILVDPKIKE